MPHGSKDQKAINRLYKIALLAHKLRIACGDRLDLVR